MTNPAYVQEWPYASFSSRSSGHAAMCVVPAQPPIDSATFNKVLDGVQLCLDGVGLIPGFGEAADALNAFISGLRGDYFGAALSIVCMVPVAGYVGNALKAGRHLSPNGVITVLRNLGEPVLKAVASAAGELAQFVARLPQKLGDVLGSLRRWRFIDNDTYRAVERAIRPVVDEIDRAFAEVMGMIDEALNGRPGQFAMAGGPSQPPRNVHQMRSTGSGGRRNAGVRMFKQGDHLVNTGLKKVLDELSLLRGQGARQIAEARRILDDPDFLATVQKRAAAGDDANSIAFGRAAERVRNAAQMFREASSPGQAAARGLSLRVELRDMLKSAIDVEVAGMMNRQHVQRVEQQLTRVWSILDGTVARATQTIRP